MLSAPAAGCVQRCEAGLTSLLSPRFFWGFSKILGALKSCQVCWKVLIGNWKEDSKTLKWKCNWNIPGRGVVFFFFVKSSVQFRPPSPSCPSLFLSLICEVVLELCVCSVVIAQGDNTRGHGIYFFFQQRQPLRSQSVTEAVKLHLESSVFCLLCLSPRLDHLSLLLFSLC